MNAHGQIESQAHPVAIQPLSQVVELASYERLRHEVISLFLRVQVLDPEPSGAGRRRPVSPIPAEPLLRASEMRIANQLTILERRIGNRVLRQGRADFGVSPRDVERGHVSRGSMRALEIQDQLRPEQPAHG